MKRILYNTIGLILVVFGAIPTHAQMYIDQAGAHELFDTSSGFLNDHATVHLSFDTAQKTAKATYFDQRRGRKAGSGFLSFAYTLKLKSRDDFADIWRVSDGTSELAAVINWTGSPKTSAVLPFINLRVAYKHDRFRLFDASRSAASQLYTQTMDTGSIYISGGATINGRYGFAASVGEERDSNYEDLQQVTVTDISQIIALPEGGTRLVGNDGTSARTGDWKRIDTMPAQILGYVDVSDKAFDDLAKSIPFVPTKNVDYAGVLAGYERTILYRGGQPRHDIGVSIVVRRQKTSPGKEDTVEETIGHQEIDFPISFYIERKGIAGRGSPETITGAVFVFRFP